jgi:hypothetical protein
VEEPVVGLISQKLIAKLLGLSVVFLQGQQRGIQGGSGLSIFGLADGCF